MSKKANRAKARAARAEQIIAKQRTELILLRGELENARKRYAEILKQLDATTNVLQAEEKYLKPWRVTVDGLMRGGMRFDTYMMTLHLSPMMIATGFKYMPKNDRYFGEFQNFSIEIEYLCEKIARDVRQLLYDTLEKDNVLPGRMR